MFCKNKMSSIKFYFASLFKFNTITRHVFCLYIYKWLTYSILVIFFYILENYLYVTKYIFEHRYFHTVHKFLKYFSNIK